MVAVLNVPGSRVADWNAFITQTAGEGAASRVKFVEDAVTLSTDFLGATANYARLARFPAHAKVKRLRVFSDAALDAHATVMTLALQFGVTWSDSTKDGTPPSFQGLLPTTVGLAGGTTAGTNTTFATYATPNLCFGTITQSGATAAIPVTDITFGGAIANYPRLAFLQNSLLKRFNFLDARGAPIESAGYFDIYARVSVVAATPAQANLIALLEYVE